MENTRELALDILLTLEREGGFEGKLIKAVLDKYNYLDQRDKAFIKRLAEGTIERQIELDYYIDDFSNTPVRRMKPLIRCLMRMSAYQIIYMDSVPDSAACNEACKLVQKRKFANLKGFVNAVLRNISRNKQTLSLPDPEGDFAKYLSVKYSMPQWIVEMWLSEYDDEVVKRLLAGLLDIHPVSIRFSTLLTDEERKELVKNIMDRGVKLTESGYLPYIYTAENVENVSELPGFSEGLFTVQDVSSALSVEAADITKEDFVMDICAAPGGKTILAAEKAGKVLARDVSVEKLDLINDNLDRMRVRNVTSEVFDAAVTDETYIEKADVLIMDVPCSGLGVMGKKRDIKYHVTPDSISSLNELQKNIVGHSWQYVRPGGTLIYSTCTINPAENEEMVRWIAENFPFEPVPVLENLPEKLKNEQLYKKEIKSSIESENESEISKCCVQLLPGFNASDGFFFARLRRRQPDIKSLTLQELQADLAGIGEKTFRAKQIYEWMHKRCARSFDEMTNLSKELRGRLGESYTYTSLKAVRVQESKLDGTKKFLFELFDGNTVESVWMKYKHGNSVCISSQVGCRMGCRFCASTLDGLERNLLPSEMLDQIYSITLLTGERVSNVVVMGTGEPMDNYDNLLRFIRMLTDENGLNISQRNVTVSTCGIVPAMRKLADEHLQITLALSLHATTDEKRRRLMPIANRYSIAELMDACDYYFERTGRRITFEYSLVGGVNDTDEDASELTRLAKPRCCHINLIPVNPIKERDYVQSDAARIQAFKSKLEKNKVNATVRREMGRDIDGACGQLRRRHKESRN